MSNRANYLSVDLDFWNGSNLIPTAFLESLFQAGLPICVCVDHHNLLPHVNLFKNFRNLINIDWHSDLASYVTKGGLNCGTWVNFVKWRQRESYKWIYPRECCVKNEDKGNMDDSCDAESVGWCHEERSSPFNLPKENSKEACGWESAVYHHKTFPTNLIDKIGAIGICFSPDYLHGEKSDELAQFVLSLCEKYKVEIIKSKKQKNNKFINKFQESLAQ